MLLGKLQFFTAKKFKKQNCSSSLGIIRTKICRFIVFFMIFLYCSASQPVKPDDDLPKTTNSVNPEKNVDEEVKIDIHAPVKTPSEKQQIDLKQDQMQTEEVVTAIHPSSTGSNNTDMPSTSGKAITQLTTPVDIQKNVEQNTDAVAAPNDSTSGTAVDPSKAEPSTSANDQAGLSNTSKGSSETTSNTAYSEHTNAAKEPAEPKKQKISMNTLPAELRSDFYSKIKFESKYIILNYMIKEIYKFASEYELNSVFQNAFFKLAKDLSKSKLMKEAIYADNDTDVMENRTAEHYAIFIQYFNENNLKSIITEYLNIVKNEKKRFEEYINIISTMETWLLEGDDIYAKQLELYKRDLSIVLVHYNHKLLQKNKNKKIMEEIAGFQKLLNDPKQEFTKGQISGIYIKIYGFFNDFKIIRNKVIIMKGKYKNKFPNLDKELPKPQNTNINFANFDNLFKVLLFYNKELAPYAITEDDINWMKECVEKNMLALISGHKPYKPEEELYEECFITSIKKFFKQIENEIENLTLKKVKSGENHETKSAETTPNTSKENISNYSIDDTSVENQQSRSSANAERRPESHKGGGSQINIDDQTELNAENIINNDTAIDDDKTTENKANTPSTPASLFELTDENRILLKKEFLENISNMIITQSKPLILIKLIITSYVDFWSYYYSFKHDKEVLFFYDNLSCVGCNIKKLRINRNQWIYNDEADIKQKTIVSLQDLCDCTFYHLKYKERNSYEYMKSLFADLNTINDLCKEIENKFIQFEKEILDTYFSLLKTLVKKEEMKKIQSEFLAKYNLEKIAITEKYNNAKDISIKKVLK